MRNGKRVPPLVRERGHLRRMRFEHQQRHRGCKAQPGGNREHAETHPVEQQAEDRRRAR
jgi:hypothetical protein